MSDSQMREGCPHHYTITQGVNQALADSNRALAMAQQVKDACDAQIRAQKEHQDEMKKWADGLENTLTTFKSDTNTEIYGEKGPSGAEGVKPIAHDNRRRITVLEDAKKQTGRDWITIMITTASQVLAALLLYLLLTGRVPLGH